MADEIEDILKSVDELAKRGKITRNKAFAAWYAINFFDVDEDDALESAAGDGGNDQGIDIAFTDASREEIVVVQAHCPENFSKKTPKDKWNTVVAALPFIKAPKKLVAAGRPDLAEALQKLSAENPGYKYSVGLITMGLKSDAIEKSLHAHETDNPHSGVSFFHFAQEDIRAQYRALVGADDGIPDDELKFVGAHFEDTGAYGRAWVGSVTAKELKRLHKNHQDRLFAGNVRLFLGNRKGGINEQIIKTAQSTPGNFWALNNGITIVADSASIVKTGSGGSTLKLKRFSIVNGCQTTSSLVRADASSSAKVLARVIAAKSGLKNEIVRYNNSQNAVRIWTVRAVDDIQEQLRSQFQVAGITYAPKQSGSRRKRDPMTIELDKVAQYLASAQPEFLIQAIDNKSELFDKPYQTIFKKGIAAPAVYLAWLVGNMADQERQVLAKGLGDDENVHLLGVTSVYWIVFCSYKMMAKFSDLSAAAITLPKMKSAAFNNALLKYVKKAVSTFWDAAVDTYDREVFGSIKSTLRSPAFLKKMESKINGRIVKIKDKELPDLAAAAKSATG